MADAGGDANDGARADDGGDGVVHRADDNGVCVNGRSGSDADAAGVVDMADAPGVFQIEDALDSDAGTGLDEDVVGNFGIVLDDDAGANADTVADADVLADDCAGVNLAIISPTSLELRILTDELLMKRVECGARIISGDDAEVRGGGFRESGSRD